MKSSTWETVDGVRHHRESCPGCGRVHNWPDTEAKIPDSGVSLRLFDELLEKQNEQRATTSSNECM